MKSAVRPLAFWLLAIKAAIFVAVPFAAYAAEQTIARFELEEISAFTWCFLFAFSTAGWAVVQLDALVEWFPDQAPGAAVDKRVLWQRRLAVVLKPFVAANCAGVLFYFLSTSGPKLIGWQAEAPEMLVFIGVFFAAMGGLKFLEWVRGRFFPGS